jgi:ABC-2 type transport system ATP-binding protein
VSASIVTAGLGRRFGSTWALQEVSVTVPAGSVCALVGANGAGKTTFLRLLAGVAKASTGSARVADRQPGDDADFLRHVGYVAQDMPLYRRWSVDDHLRLGAELNRGWDGGAARDRLTALGIPLGRKVGALSGGMRAQVALALALGKQPEVLLLDEPLAALDPLARRDFMATVVEAVAERPLTVLLSSHLLPDLERICDRVIVFAGGRLVLADSIDDVLASHCVLTAATRDTAVLERDHSVVEMTSTARQVSAVVRRRGPLVEPGWDVAEMSLEEVVLAYLGQRTRADPRHLTAAPLVEEGR